MKYLVFAYILLGSFIAPIAICLIPVTVALFTENEAYAWWMFLSVPGGLATTQFFWGKALDKIFDWLESKEVINAR